METRPLERTKQSEAGADEANQSEKDNDAARQPVDDSVACGGRKFGSRRHHGRERDNASNRETQE